MAQPERLPRFQPRRTPRTSSDLSVDVATILLLCALAVGLGHLWQQGEDRVGAFAIVAFVPVTATCLFIVASALVPDLLAGGRLRFPLNLTLPAVYLMLHLASTVLWTSGIGLTLHWPELLVGRIWYSPRLILGTFAIQMGTLSLLALYRAERSVSR
jgi:hypothetical protein